MDLAPHLIQNPVSTPDYLELEAEQAEEGS